MTELPEDIREWIENAFVKECNDAVDIQGTAYSRANKIRYFEKGVTALYQHLKPLIDEREHWLGEATHWHEQATELKKLIDAKDERIRQLEGANEIHRNALDMLSSTIDKSKPSEDLPFNLRDLH